MFLGHVATLSGSLIQVFIIFFGLNRPWLGRERDFLTFLTQIYEQGKPTEMRLSDFSLAKKTACQYGIDPYYKLPRT